MSCKSCKKRGRKTAATTDAGSLSDESDLRDDELIRSVASESGFLPSFYGAGVKELAKKIIGLFRVHSGECSASKRTKTTTTRKRFRGTFCFGDPFFDGADLRATEDSQYSNGIEYVDKRKMSPPITTGQSFNSPDIDWNRAVPLMQCSLWDAFHSHKQGEINRTLTVSAKAKGAEMRSILSVRIKSMMRSTFEKHFNRKSQNKDKKRYLVFWNEKNTKYPGSLLLLHGNWLLQLVLKANTGNGRIEGMFDRSKDLGICAGFEFMSNTEMKLYLYSGNDENEAATHLVLQMCSLKLYRYSTPGFEMYPLDDEVLLSVKDCGKSSKVVFNKKVSVMGPSIATLPLSMAAAIATDTGSLPMIAPPFPIPRISSPSASAHSSSASLPSSNSGTTVATPYLPPLPISGILPTHASKSTVNESKEVEYAQTQGLVAEGRVAYAHASVPMAGPRLVQPYTTMQMPVATAGTHTYAFQPTVAAATSGSSSSLQFPPSVATYGTTLMSAPTSAVHLSSYAPATMSVAVANPTVATDVNALFLPTSGSYRVHAPESGFSPIIGRRSREPWEVPNFAEVSTMGNDDWLDFA